MITIQMTSTKTILQHEKAPFNYWSLKNVKITLRQNVATVIVSSL